VFRGINPDILLLALIRFTIILRFKLKSVTVLSFRIVQKSIVLTHLLRLLVRFIENEVKPDAGKVFIQSTGMCLWQLIGLCFLSSKRCLSSD
jgi:hypothetical protein